MAGLINNLIDTLKGQTTHFKAVIALSDDKKRAIIENDVEALRDIVKKENIIVPKALKGDKERERIMGDMATVLNKPANELTLALIAEMTQGQPEHAEFTAAVDEFAQTVLEMKHANDSNKLLIESALEYIDFNMNIIHSTLDAQPAGYGALDDEHQQGSFLDARS